MTFTQLLNILIARKKAVFFIAVFVVLSAVVVALVLPKKYKAVNTVIFNYKQSDPISGSVIQAQLMQNYMATEVDIISSKSIALEVVKSLKLDIDLELKEKFDTSIYAGGDFENWLADQILEGLTVTPSRRSNLIYITFEDKSPTFAAEAANAFSEAYIKKSIELKVAPSQRAANFYTEQLAGLQTKIEEANQKYTQYLREHDLQKLDGRTVDVETARLNELSNKLVFLQAQLSESQSRKNAASKSMSGSPDVASDSVVQLMKGTLATAQANFAEVASKYASNHPDYIAAQKQVDQASASLNRQMSIVSKSVSSSASIYAQSEAEVRAALEKQRKKVLDLNAHQNASSLLEQDLLNAQKAYDAANQRYIETNLEGKSNQSNVALLNKAVVPTLADSPKKKIIVLVAGLLGPLLGMAFVLVRELFDRRIRSVEDLESLLEVPAFGVLPKYEVKHINANNHKLLSFKN